MDCNAFHGRKMLRTGQTAILCKHHRNLNQGMYNEATTEH